MEKKPVHISKIYEELKVFYNYRKIWKKIDLLDYETLWQLYTFNNYDVIKLKEQICKN